MPRRRHVWHLRGSCGREGMLPQRGLLASHLQEAPVQGCSHFWRETRYAFPVPCAWLMKKEVHAHAQEPSSRHEHTVFGSFHSPLATARPLLSSPAPCPQLAGIRELAQDDWLPSIHETCSGPGEATVSSITCSIADPRVKACRPLRTQRKPGLAFWAAPFVLSLLRPPGLWTWAAYPDPPVRFPLCSMACLDVCSGFSCVTSARPWSSDHTECFSDGTRLETKQTKQETGNCV